MARPSKATVEYFPLDCQFGDTMRAIEDIYGNDGFIVWIKLLQKLGRSENHFIDVRTNMNWKLFYSIFKLEETKVINILDSFAELGCIDKTLWENKIIYSQNFVNRIADAYRKRKIVLMTYEDILEHFGISDGRNPQEQVVSDVKNPVSDVGNPQIKLKESKVKESKEYSLSLIEEKLTREEREILKLYSLKECNAKNPDAYVASLIRSGDYKRILQDIEQKKDDRKTSELNMQVDFKKVTTLLTACAFIGKYGDYTDEKHPDLVREIMKKFGITSFSDATQKQYEEMKKVCYG